MFTIDAMIDGVQNTKKQYVKTFVTNKVIAENLNKFVDAQTEYTKNVVKASTDSWTMIMQEMMKTAKESTQFDYVKFGEGIMKAYQNPFKM